jgi:hypothetical protein
MIKGFFLSKGRPPVDAKTSSLLTVSFIYFILMFFL